MSRRALLRAVALAGSAPLLAAGCAYDSVPGLRYAPPLLRLERDGAPGRIVLLGTVHAGLPRFFPLPAPVEQAFSGAGRLLVEIDAERQSAAIRETATELALLPDGGTIESVLDRRTLRTLRRALHDRPWELAGLRRLQPWALALLLPGADDERLGASPAEGVDRHLIRRARARPMPVIELESPASQVRAFAGGPLDEQRALLALRLEQRASHARTWSRIVDAWRLGDLAALAALKEQAFPSQGPLAPLRHRLFTERDERIADRLAERLDEPGPAMALVGTLHLAGPDALQRALAARGLAVRPIA